MTIKNFQLDNTERHYIKVSIRKKKKIKKSGRPNI